MKFVIFDLESALNVHLKHLMWILYSITQNHLKNRRYLNIPGVIFKYSILIFKYLQMVKYSGYLNIIFHCQMEIFSAVRYENSIYLIIIILKYLNILFIIIEFIILYETFSVHLSKILIVIEEYGKEEYNKDKAYKVKASVHNQHSHRSSWIWKIYFWKEDDQ